MACLTIAEATFLQTSSMSLNDSFGRLPFAQWQPRLRGIETTDPDAEQQPPVNPDGSKTEWCGQACLAFGLVCKAYGYNIARAV